jgi:3'(2'), 5'-bisphosphate nucleotidase
MTSERTETSARIVTQRDDARDPAGDRRGLRPLAADRRRPGAAAGARGDRVRGRPALKAAGDKAAHDLLRAELARWRPADAVLSEEDDHSRLAWQDGEPDRPPGAARRRPGVDRRPAGRHPGVLRGGPHRLGRARGALDGRLSSPSCLAAGAVAMPAQHRTIATDSPAGVPAAAAGAAGPIRIAASRTRPPAFVTALAEEIGAELVPMGSAGVKIAAVISGEADAYVHAGGQYEWDSAAPVAVATATGLHASRIDGSALKYNEADPKLPDLVVCRKDLATRLLAALQRHSPLA